jgi:hypothetical protein
MQEEFIEQNEQNKLVQPTIIRESTNRSNIKYLISLEDGSGTLLEKAATLVRTFKHSRSNLTVVAIDHPLLSLAMPFLTRCRPLKWP